MDAVEPRRLYQQLAAELKQRIETGVYQVEEKLLRNGLSPKRKTSAVPSFAKQSSCWKWKATLRFARAQVFTSCLTRPNT